MPNVEIEQTIFRETQGLSANALQEVLDFIQFIKMKEHRKEKKHFASRPEYRYGITNIGYDFD